MNETAPLPQSRFPRVAIALALVAGCAVAGAIGLWAHFGGAVFYQMIESGIAACF